MSVGPETQRYARAAVDNYLKTVVYPVIYGRQEGLITLGTSVLFECSGRHFMLTAAHLFEKYEGPRFPFEGLVGPTTRQMGIPIGLGHLTALVPGAAASISTSSRSSSTTRTESPTSRKNGRSWDPLTSRPQCSLRISSPPT